MSANQVNEADRGPIGARFAMLAALAAGLFLVLTAPQSSAAPVAFKLPAPAIAAGPVPAGSNPSGSTVGPTGPQPPVKTVLLASSPKVGPVAPILGTASAPGSPAVSADDLRA